MTKTPPANTTTPGSARPRWQFRIDRGGTFTDLVARTPDGNLITHKLLSENPERYADAALQGIRDILGLGPNQPLPVNDIEAIKMGTTVATNALLERQGARTVLVTTKGFHDALQIGHQTRPDIFALEIKTTPRLYETVIEAHERIGSGGEIITPLDQEKLLTQLTATFRQGLRSCAIVFMHGYRHPEHERLAEKIARQAGFENISLSHQVSPTISLIGRGDTTVVDAYLSPVLDHYVSRVSGQTGDIRLQFMKSDGGLTDAKEFRGKDAILSGPAGGINAMAATAKDAGFDKIIGFDMGGTSTDVSHYAGEFERRYETEVAGVRMRVPMTNIHTVAAGGGSILHFEHGRFRVGPDSAGANPGPACYRRGGPLTVTDCNLQLGKLQPDYFPRVFGEHGNQPLDKKIVTDKFNALAAEILNKTGTSMTADAIAEGFLQVACQNMAAACRKISTARGFDISHYVLNCFGGAGGQHACLVADALNMKKILLHPYAGVLSAYGMGLAPVTIMHRETVEAPLDTDTLSQVEKFYRAQKNIGMKNLIKQGAHKEHIETERKLHIKYSGTDSTLLIHHGSVEEITQHFEAAHRQQFGFTMEAVDLMVASAEIEIIAKAPDRLKTYPVTKHKTRKPVPISRPRITMAGQTRNTPVYHRQDLSTEHLIHGPAVILESVSTIVVEPGWLAKLKPGGELVLERKDIETQAKYDDTAMDPVRLEIFNNRFMSIAEQMGVTLRNTAYSTNIKERLDFSCALFDGTGALVANAPHVPVHLGSMGESVRAMLKTQGHDIRPGDVFMLNSPYNGGTHLPDITVVTPVFNTDESKILFYVASRAHHADIGGITPGSMPPLSRTIEQEGVLIDVFKLVEKGRFREKQCLKLLNSGTCPSRNPKQNMLDLKAQIAANKKGATELMNLVDETGLDTVTAYMTFIQDNAEQQVRSVIAVLKNGSFELPMDGGAKIRVAIAINHQDRSATIDFTGTSRQQQNNFNAPKAITHAAVLYVFRTLVQSDIPLNEGCMRPLRIITPKGSMLNPDFPAAVVAGNVEVSQCVTDALYAALGIMASSQGTMNNFTFGDDSHQHYETICGGGGAGPDFKGADTVHTHMTNSRLTDPEILEWRFPVRVEEFSVRQQSGGNGLNPGGNGAIRRIRFLHPMTAAILSGRRQTRPFAMKDGHPGKSGVNSVTRSDGTTQILSGCEAVEMAAGDIFSILTPGGGGWGKPKK